jgi:hypothetical protein
MKKHFITFALAVVVIVPVFFAPQTNITQAACVQTGKLSGTIAITNLDRDTVYDEVIVSDETWNSENASNPTSENFEVAYKDGRFSGRGWSEVYGWVDFNFGSADELQFENVNENPEEWGSWSGNFTQLSTVEFSTNDGSWKGAAYSAEQTGSNPDVYVGAVLDFEHSTTDLKFDTTGDCDERVDLFINSSKTLNRVNCPISTPTIRWTSENVGSCEASGDLWSSTGSKADNNTSGETAAGPVTESGTYASPQTIRLTCIGDDSGAEIEASATARCGDEVDTGDPTDGDTPIFQEV